MRLLQALAITEAVRCGLGSEFTEAEVREAAKIENVARTLWTLEIALSLVPEKEHEDEKV